MDFSWGMRVFHTTVFCDASPALGQTPFKMYGCFISLIYFCIYCGMPEYTENLSTDSLRVQVSQTNINSS